MNIPERSPDIRVDRINELADNIEVSKTFDQDCWHSCGSPACVAGHAIVMFAPNFLHFPKSKNMKRSCYIDNQGKARDIYAEARWLLGLDSLQAYELFGSHTLAELDCFVPTAEDAAEVLRHLARTDTVDWRICQ